jgi:hypothetical protein
MQEFKEGDLIKSGERIYKVVKKDGVIGVIMKYYGFISMDKFVEEFHGKLTLLK